MCVCVCVKKERDVCRDLLNQSILKPSFKYELLLAVLLAIIILFFFSYKETDQI